MFHFRRALLGSLAPLPLLLISPPHALAEGRVLFQAKPGIAQAAFFHAHGGTTLTGLTVRRLRVAGSPAAEARRIRMLPGVAWAEPEGRIHALKLDPLQSSQWALGFIHAEQGWALAGLTRVPALIGVPIGIVDTGVDTKHEDLKGRITACAASTAGRVKPGVCEDGDGHGTHVAGIAAAATGNGVGIAGVAGASPLIICRALSAKGSGSTGDVAACIAWVAAQGAKVVNLSLGGPDSHALHTAIQTAARSGAVIVAAAGNSGPSEVSWPAAYPEVISVAASDPNGHRADFSNTNRDVELTAPGTNILSCKAHGGYVRMSGTSMAAPMISGAAALVWSILSRPTPASVRAALDHSARDVGTRGRDASYGFGLFDFALTGQSG